MIKWPEPVMHGLKAAAGRYGNICYSTLAMAEHSIKHNPPSAGYTAVSYYTEAQLKQAVRDALNLAADTCESTLYVEGDGAVSVFGPKTDANVEIRKCRDAIRALIKEI